MLVYQRVTYVKMNLKMCYQCAISVLSVCYQCAINVNNVNNPLVQRDILLAYDKNAVNNISKVAK